MDQRNPFFIEVDKVINILETASESRAVKPKDSTWAGRRVAVIQEVRVSGERWEHIIQQLRPYRKEVLQYVARLFRAREGQMSRRVMTILGNPRGAGLLGLVVAAFAVASVIGLFRNLLPTVDAGWFIGLFVLLAAMIIIPASGAITGVHPANHLLYLADLLDAAVALRNIEDDARSQRQIEEGDPEAALISQI